MHGGLLMCNNARWLSRGNILQRFVECLDEIIFFFTTKKFLKSIKSYQMANKFKINVFYRFVLTCKRIELWLARSQQNYCDHVSLNQSIQSKTTSFLSKCCFENLRVFQKHKKIFFTT